jgi:hypothetical protein
MKNTKLTLSIDKDIIEKAKIYARNRKRSLSNLIEDYLKSLTVDEQKDDFEYTPIVQSLKGAIQVDPATFDYRQTLEDELFEKYLLE